MKYTARNAVPSALLTLIGVYVAFMGVQEYLGPGSRLGILPEIVLAVFLLLGAATVAVGGYALANDRPQLSLTGLVGFLTAKLTFVTGVYSISANTQLVVPLGMAIIVAAMAGTWLLSG